MKKILKNKSIKIGRIISTILTVVCVLLCLFITLEVIRANNEDRPPRILSISVSYVPTPSMEPTIHAGEYVAYKKVNYDDIKEKDIIIYKSKINNIYIIHRVEKICDGYLITKGDNNSSADIEHVTSDMVYGRYIMTLGFLSIFSGGISKNVVFTVLILIFLVMIIMQIVSIAIKNKADEIKKNTEEEKQLMLEKLKQEILAEELEKLKQQKDNQNK